MRLAAAGQGQAESVLHAGGFYQAAGEMMRDAAQEPGEEEEFEDGSEYYDEEDEPQIEAEVREPPPGKTDGQ